MRVLVTGAGGFLGSELATEFCRRGAAVYGCDDLSNNCVELDSLPLSGAYECDVVDALSIRRSHDYKCDLVVHTAGPVGAVGILSQKGRIASEITRTTAAVTDYCRWSGAKLLYVSSSEVYGFSGTYREDNDLRVPASPNARLEYAVGKIAGEYTVRLGNVPHIVIRPFNMVGSRQRSEGGFVVPTFCQQALRGERLTIFGDGTQRRAFTAVKDVAEWAATVPLIDYRNQVLNIGNPKNETSILELARMISLKTGAAYAHTDGKVMHGPDYAEAEGHTKLPNVERAEQLGWDPHRSVEEIVNHTLEIYRAEPVAGGAK